MAKRGETFPFRVTFVWDTGVKGTVVCSDLWSAEHKADEIRAAAEMQNRTVEVQIVEVAK